MYTHLCASSSARASCSGMYNMSLMRQICKGAFRYGATLL
jgi:hypothetical protein